MIISNSMLILGHSGSNQHEKWSPFTDFLETWYAHTLCQVTANKMSFTVRSCMAYVLQHSKLLVFKQNLGILVLKRWP